MNQAKHMQHTLKMRKHPNFPYLDNASKRRQTPNRWAPQLQESISKLKREYQNKTGVWGWTLDQTNAPELERGRKDTKV